MVNNVTVSWHCVLIDSNTDWLLFAGRLVQEVSAPTNGLYISWLHLRSEGSQCTLHYPPMAILFSHTSKTQVFIPEKQKSRILVLWLSGNSLRGLTCWEARYSMPQATWCENDTRSLCVSWISSGSPRSWLLYALRGRWLRRKSLRFPCWAYSTTTYRGSLRHGVIQPIRLIMFLCGVWPNLFITSSSCSKSISSRSVASAKMIEQTAHRLVWLYDCRRPFRKNSHLMVYSNDNFVKNDVGRTRQILTDGTWAVRLSLPCIT